MLPTIKQLRDAAGGLSNLTDEEIIQASYPDFQRYYPDMDAFAGAMGYSGARRGQTGSRFSASIDDYQANLYGLGGAAARAVGADGVGAWMDRGREANQSAADYASQRARSLGAVDDWRDVTGPGSALNYAGGLAIQSAPYLVESLAGGVVGRGLATGAKAALRGAGTAEAASAARTALNRAGMAGATVASYPSAVADILSNQREENGGEDLSMAALGGVPYAALNGALGADALLARGVRPTNLLSGNLPTRVGKAAGRTALEEGISETGQEMINQGFGRMGVNPDQTLFNADANKRYLDSFVGGATLGGVFGGAGGLRGRDDNAPTDLLQQPGQLALSGGESAPASSPLFVNLNGDPVIASAGIRDAGVDTAQMEVRRRDLLAEKQEAIHNLDLIEQQYGKSDMFYTALQGIYPRIDVIDKELEQIDRHLARYGDQSVQTQTGFDFSEPSMHEPYLGLQWDGRTQGGRGQTPFHIFPDGSTATSQDQELQHRYGIPAEQLAAMRSGAPRTDPRMASGNRAPYLPNVMVADAGGQVALDAPGAEALYGRDDGSLGTAIARENWLKQREAGQKLKQGQAEVRAETARRNEVKQRAEGYGLRGTAAFDAFDKLEQMRDRGDITEAQFKENVVLLGERRVGAVNNWMKAIGPTMEALKAPLNQTPINPPAPKTSVPAASAAAKKPKADPAPAPKAAPVVETPAAAPPVPPVPKAHAEHDGVYLHKLGVQDAGQALREHDETMNVLEELINCLKKKR